MLFFAAQFHVQCTFWAVFLQAICLAYEAVGRPDSVPTVVHLLTATFAYSNLYPQVPECNVRRREIEKEHKD